MDFVARFMRGGASSLCSILRQRCASAARPGVSSIFLTVALLFSAATQAASHAPASMLKTSLVDAKYAAPNEEFPERVLKVINGYQEGALISVGTERALMTAILAKKITSIVQADIDPGIVQYNRINRELLRLAKSRHNYLFLRLSATREQWLERVGASDSILKEDGIYDWWMAKMKDTRFHKFHSEAPGRDVNSERPEIRFAHAHYLFDDEAFARIQWFAKNDKIEVRSANIANEEDMQTLISETASRGPISLVDISNAWWNGYAGEDAAMNLSHIVATADPKARLILTFRSADMDWMYASHFAGDPRLFYTIRSRVGTRPAFNLNYFLRKGPNCNSLFLGGDS